MAAPDLTYEGESALTAPNYGNDQQDGRGGESENVRHSDDLSFGLFQLRNCPNCHVNNMFSFCQLAFVQADDYEEITSGGGGAGTGSHLVMLAPDLCLPCLRRRPAAAHNPKHITVVTVSPKPVGDKSISCGVLRALVHFYILQPPAGR